MALFLFSRFNSTKFFNPKYFRLATRNNVMFREEAGRLGLVADNKTNFAFRVFIVKSDEVCDLERSSPADKISGPLLESIQKDVGSIYTAINEQLEKIVEPNSTPTRLQIFFNKDDDYYSVVFGFKFKARNCINTEILRYIIPLGMGTYGRFMHLVAWNHHESNSAWDYAHVSDSPAKEFTPVEIVGFFFELAHLKDEVVVLDNGKTSKIVKVTRKRIFKPKDTIVTPSTNRGVKDGDKKGAPVDPISPHLDPNRASNPNSGDGLGSNGDDSSGGKVDPDLNSGGDQ